MPGGCSLNTACILRGLGLSVTLGGNAVGDDARGTSILEYLQEIGMDSRIIQRPGLKTPFCQCLVEKAEGKRDFILEHSDIQKFEDDLLGTLAREIREGKFQQIFIQPYVRDACRALLQAAGNFESAWILTQDLPPESEFVPQVDAIQVSLSDEQDFETSAVEKIAQPYFRGRLKTVFVTAGPQGIGVVEKGNPPTLIPGLKAQKILDTTGCGDAFRAGLMWGRAQGLDLLPSVNLGQKLGAYKAGVYGSHFLADSVHFLDEWRQYMDPSRGLHAGWRRLPHGHIQG